MTSSAMVTSALYFDESYIIIVYIVYDIFYILHDTYIYIYNILYYIYYDYIIVIFGLYIYVMCISYHITYIIYDI